MEICASDPQVPPIIIGENKSQSNKNRDERISSESCIIIAGLKPYETVKLSHLNIIVRGVTDKDSKTNKK